MENPKPLKVEENMVVTMDFKLTVDGEVIEDSSESEPIQFLQGAGQVLAALEEQLDGMVVGDEKQVTLQPADGYGELDPEAYSDIDRSEFPEEIPMEVGIELELRDQDGDVHYAVIEEVKPDTVRLNFNHMLAGKVLEFSVHIVALREASADEIEHGHAHGGHEHDDEE